MDPVTAENKIQINVLDQNIRIDNKVYWFEYPQPEGIRVIRFDVKKQTGEVEWSDDEAKKPRKLLDNFDEYQYLIDDLNSWLSRQAPSPDYEETSPGVWVKSLRKVKDKKKLEIADALDQELTSGVECIAGASDTYEMGCQLQDAYELQLLIELAELENKNNVTIFGRSGEPYKNISLDDAKEVWQQVAVAIRTQKEKAADIIRTIEKDLDKVDDAEDIVWE